MLKWVQQSQPTLRAGFKKLCSLAGCRRRESGSKQTAASTAWALRGLSAENLLDEGLGGELFSFHKRCACLHLADVQFLLFAATGEKTVVSDLHEACGQNVHSKWRSLSCAAPWTAGDFAGNLRRTARIHLVLQSLHDTFGLRPRFLGSVSNGL